MLTTDARVNYKLTYEPLANGELIKQYTVLSPALE